jgi:uroporphyrinogen III methyltransferase/synthase
LDARALSGATVAAIGPGTAEALRAHGIAADVMPGRFLAEGLVQALAETPVTRALVARAAEARDVLPDALRERGAEVDVLALYETVAEPLSDAQIDRVRAAGYVTFTSSSTVRYLVASLGGDPGLAGRLISIGPVTSQALRDHGLEPHLEAAQHDIEGLIEALLADVAARTL